ncbi:hypothetical protein [Couchioplanes caeruleus]|uniref:Uncharacterized protein n=2 Tax=Couchioplanes caeruleus TaxID=56438 RepID=A0A1K0FHZ0_9ACTN|nr:hypothetical protein [Couchioplanes caeruleus]OJF12449.1 hypothetical protein BG844_20485 [Couchioplanes caeruleus subsp. caeruleus]ROP34250.1 hypothetical protein EDD30_7329 [Couchioplanes caeruleus]
MTDQYAELEAALDRVVEAARAHLAAVKAAQGRVDDDDVWQAYVALNNTSYAYDEQLLDAFGEVTPWDVESIDPDEADARFGASAGADGHASADPYAQVISVRQRRDYRVPSVAALLRVADAARRNLVPEDEEPGAVESVGEAVLELLQAGDGSLSSLDVPELEPLDGLLTVSEVKEPLDLEAFPDEDGAGPFTPGADDQLVGRLDEHPFLPDEEDEHAGHH